jgi:hypothetical protein
MQPVFLNRLNSDIRSLVEHIELQTRLEVYVELNPMLNSGGPFGAGKLTIDIESDSVKLNAPTNDYFPDGAVRHELLHVQRFHLEHVPRVSLSEDASYNKILESALAQVDNSLEHLIIVPNEIALHPERQKHWEAIMHRLWAQEIPSRKHIDEVQIWAFLNWTFLKKVLPDSPSVGLATQWLQRKEMLQRANMFCDQTLAVLDDKAATLQTFFSTFTQLPQEAVALEYLSSAKGSRFEPLLKTHIRPS